MPTRRIMLQVQPEASDATGKIAETVEKSGGRMLPSPRIFPPVLHFTVSEEIANEIKTKYESAILRIMNDEEDDDDE
ncbi:hypothetical protein N7513_001469 [Penicillium frequentans]|uniref:Uncharacterized protein n=1 Tax=Penicillium frequentans TaxID=3151616 RepID=A0AAD6CNI1_9EURO|nr:hypothetical protein N7494_008700 [Penicillium glabrum]KAJ5565227.1 hypothetical protein N7513_001469 [Penicillium glabrum]